MSDTDEPYVAPDDTTLATGSYEVIRESYDGPTASIESIRADSLSRTSMDGIRLSDAKSPNDPPAPSVDYEKRSL